MLFIAASSSCWDEPAHHLRCGWQNGSLCQALEEGERGEEKKEGGGGLFPPSRLERDAKASPRGRWGRMRPQGCLLSPASPSRLLPVGPLLPLFLVFLLSLPVSLRVCYPSLSFSELSLPLPLVFLQHTHTYTHISPVSPREKLLEPSSSSHGRQRADDPRLEHRVLVPSNLPCLQTWTSILIPVALPTSVGLIFSCN